MRSSSLSSRTGSPAALTRTDPIGANDAASRNTSSSVPSLVTKRDPSWQIPQPSRSSGTSRRTASVAGSRS